MNNKADLETSTRDQSTFSMEMWAVIHALVDIMVDKGLITREELEEMYTKKFMELL